MEILLGALAEAIIGIVIQDLAQRPKLASLRERLGGSSLEKVALHQALATAYMAFSAQHPDLTASFFDEHYLRKHEVSQQLAKLLTPNQEPDPEILEQLWSLQFNIKPNIELKQPIISFLTILENEIKGQPHLKPFVDSRAFDQLYIIAERTEDQVTVQTQVLQVLTEIRILLEQAQQGRTDVDLHSPDISPSSLPPKSYDSFVGRSEQLDIVMNALRKPDSQSIIAVTGLGGIGKTALAQEVVEHCTQEDLFNHIVWTSYKTEHLVREDIVNSEVTGHGLDDLLNDIGRQCNQLEITKLSSEEKKAAAKYLLATRRVLIVMDNLETVPNQEKLVTAIFQILGKSRLLITSRHKLENKRVFTISLEGFPEEEGITFLRKHSRDRNIETVFQASYPQLVETHQVTGGAPLAMQLVIGQMSSQPMEIVLKTLKEAGFQSQDYQFYRFVYQYSWNILDMEARKVLVDMSVFPPITGGAAADVEAVSQVKQSVFWTAIRQLVILSLVDKSGVIGQERYALHPLTQYFIRSDITKEWANR